MLKVAPLLLGMLLLELATMSRMSATYDEWAHVEYGKSVLDRRAAGPATQKMAITLLNYLPLHGLRAATGGCARGSGPSRTSAMPGSSTTSSAADRRLVADVGRRGPVSSSCA